MSENNLSGKKRGKAGKSGKVWEVVMEYRSEGVRSPGQGRKRASGRSRSMFMRVWCMPGRSISRSGVGARRWHFRILIFDFRLGNFLQAEDDVGPVPGSREERLL